MRTLPTPIGQSPTSNSPGKETIGPILSGVGAVLVGLAAVIGACAAHTVANKVTFNNNNSITNNVQMNVPQACKSYSDLKAAFESPELGRVIQSLPEKPAAGQAGLLITGKYKSALLDDIKNSPASQRDSVIQKYYDLSLSDLGFKPESGDPKKP